MACKALDDQVAVPKDAELKALLDRFVCVRKVQMHGVDLQTFAFDGSLTWAVFLMNADGTIYGRYGSRSALGKRSSREISLAGFKQTLKGALDLHARYTADRRSVGQLLAAKRGNRKPPWATPEQIPTLKANARLNRPFTGVPGRHGGCIHCHMVPANELRSLRLAGREVPDRAFLPYPLPNQLGFRMDPEQQATVLSIRPDSEAARAGLQENDRILAISGQPILSTADIQWVLHNARDDDALSVDLLRGGRALARRLELAPGWRLRLRDWRFINKGLLRQVLGFNVDQMPARRARRLGLGGKLALVVDRTTRALRMQTGLGNRDMLVAIDGKREPLTVAALTAYVFRKKKKGDILRVTVMQLTDRFPRPEHEVEVAVH